MSLFSSYEQEFGALLADLNRKTNLIPDLTGADKDKEMRSAEKDIEDAKELLEQMELELMDMGAAERGKSKARVTSYKGDLAQAERDLRKAAVKMSNSAAARDELFAYDGTSEDARSSLLTNTDRLDRTSRRLDDGHRVALETQEVAVGIMSDLHDQRETIQRSRGRLRNMDGELSTSRRVLRNIIDRARRNKAVTAIIILMCLAVIGIIIYLMTL
eukprot:UC1_evm1s956